jgi:hypothetical protein
MSEFGRSAAPRRPGRRPPIRRPAGRPRGRMRTGIHRMPRACKTAAAPGSGPPRLVPRFLANSGSLPAGKPASMAGRGGAPRLPALLLAALLATAPPGAAATAAARRQCVADGRGARAPAAAPQRACRPRRRSRAHRARWAPQGCCPTRAHCWRRSWRRARASPAAQPASSAPAGRRRGAAPLATRGQTARASPARLAASAAARPCSWNPAYTFWTRPRWSRAATAAGQPVPAPALRRTVRMALLALTSPPTLAVLAPAPPAAPPPLLTLTGQMP